MAYNKVTYGGKTLIDLTSDTVTADTLLAGYTAHAKDGSVVTGSFLSDYPSEYVLSDEVTDSDGDDLIDSDGDAILSRIVYRKV